MLKRIVLFIMIFFSFYVLGVSHCKQKQLSQKVEAIKYVKDKEIEILSTPNADKPDLLKLMYDNKL